MKKALLLLMISLPQLALAQKWVDTVYNITVQRDSLYGTSIDFAGNERALYLDIAIPNNDTPPKCGRPLVVVLYGGAWMAGDKSNVQVQQLLRSFAKRGYVAIAPNYRLGFFQTNIDRNCNLSSFNLEWNCLNAQDTLEWYRAYYRAVQDVKGAIRYMIHRAQQYKINPNNVFTTGFSAGGFTALGAAFLDHPSEWLGMAGEISDALTPNTRYDLGCVRKYQWDTTLASMDLARPSLGSFEGSLNQAANYRIRAVGNLFGGMFYNLLDSGTTQPASIYGFHQPNDLIVPYQANKRVFDGYSACAYSLCHQGIINRPYASSSPTIRNWAAKAGVEFHFDSTLNTTDCSGQIADPSKGGHQLDNWQRTWNMAQFFATKIDTNDCATSMIIPYPKIEISIYPNPVIDVIQFSSNHRIERIIIYDVRGERKFDLVKIGHSHTEVDIHLLRPGIYFAEIFDTAGAVSRQRFVKLHPH